MRTTTRPFDLRRAREWKRCRHDRSREFDAEQSSQKARFLVLCCCVSKEARVTDGGLSACGRVRRWTAMDLICKPCLVMIAI